MRAVKEWVELGPTGLAIRIFRSKKAAAIYAVNPNRGLLPDPVLRRMEKAEAVGQIRRQVFERDEYACVSCGEPVIWERGSVNSGEMDERQARGQCLEIADGVYRSGEVSVENGQTLCRECHTGRGGKHDRAPSFQSTSGCFQSQSATEGQE